MISLSPSSTSTATSELLLAFSSKGGYTFITIISNHILSLILFFSSVPVEKAVLFLTLIYYYHHIKSYTLSDPFFFFVDSPFLFLLLSLYQSKKNMLILLSLITISTVVADCIIPTLCAVKVGGTNSNCAGATTSELCTTASTTGGDVANACDWFDALAPTNGEIGTCTPGASISTNQFCEFSCATGYTNKKAGYVGLPNHGYGTSQKICLNAQGFSCQLGDHPCRLSENDYQYNKFDASGAECSFCSKCFDENTGAPCTHTSAMIQGSSCKCGKAIPSATTPVTAAASQCTADDRYTGGTGKFGKKNQYLYMIPVFLCSF